MSLYICGGLGNVESFNYVGSGGSKYVNTGALVDFAVGQVDFQINYPDEQDIVWKNVTIYLQ